MSHSTVIHQPDFMPWLGFLERWKHADHLIILDDAQFLKRGWHHRDKLILNNKEVWYGLPLQQKGSYQKQINEMLLLDDVNWKKKLLKSIQLSYGKYPSFNEYYTWFEELLNHQFQFLSEINLHILDELKRIFKIKAGYTLSSNTPSELTSTERLVELCQTVGTTHYVTGMGSKEYLDESLFAKSLIEVQWHHPQSNQFYPQALANEMGLSSLHFLLKYGAPSDEN